MARQSLKLAVLLACLAISVHATVNNYFVNNVTGSDSNDGLAATTGGGHGPWKTLNHAQGSISVGSTGTVVTVAPGTFTETNCESGIAFCFTIGGTSNSARVAFVCSQNWVHGSTQGCLMEQQFEIDAINYFDFGAIGKGFDVGGPTGMPNNQSAINVISTSSSNGISIHEIGNYFHDFGQNVIFGGITGCIDGGMVAYGSGPTWATQDFEVISNFLNNYGIVGNGCTNGQGIYPANGGTSGSPTIIWNNLVMNITSYGIHYYHSPCNAYIANNTVLHVGDFGILIAAGSGDACSTDGTITLANNIVDNNASGPIRFGASGGGITCPANSILVKNNLYNGNGNGNAIFGSGTCTQVTGNVTSEASSATFSNYQSNGSGTYTLKPASLAVGGGTSTCVSGQSGCISTSTFTGANQTVPPVIGAFLPVFTTIYVSQSGGSVACGADGTQSTTPSSLVTWTAGNTYKFCGALTSQINVNASGSSGSLITILFESGSSMTSPVWANTGALNLAANSYILVDGQGVGVIKNTANGSGLANQLSSVGIWTTGGNVEIRNLTISNLYVHSSVSDATVDQTAVNCVHFSGSNVLIHNNTMHDAGWCLYEPELAGDTNISIYQNTIYNIDHGWAIGANSHSGGSNGPFSFYNNTVYGYANWDTTSNAYHHDGIHCYTAGTSGAPMHFGSLSIYNNTFNGPVGTNVTAHIFIEGGTGSGSTPCADSTSNIYIYNNVAIADAAVSNGLMGIFSGSVNVYNNTMIGSATGSGIIYLSNSDVSAAVFKNNVMTTGNQLIAITGSIPFTPDYNIYANGGSNSFVCGTNFYNTTQFASWQSCIAGDSHSTYNASAILGSLGMPQVGSPAIGAGVNLTSLGITALDSDILGVPRPASGAWAAGAYQVAVQVPIAPIPSVIIILGQILYSGVIIGL